MKSSHRDLCGARGAIPDAKLNDDKTDFTSNQGLKSVFLSEKAFAPGVGHITVSDKV